MGGYTFFYLELKCNFVKGVFPAILKHLKKQLSTVVYIQCFLTVIFIVNS